MHFQSRFIGQRETSYVSSLFCSSSLSALLLIHEFHNAPLNPKSEINTHEYQPGGRIANSILMKTEHAVESRARSSSMCCALEMLQISSNEELTYDTCDSGPALSGKLLVFSTWIPACWTPLKGVMIGLVWPGSQPLLKGTLGSLNQRPR